MTKIGHNLVQRHIDESLVFQNELGPRVKACRRNHAGSLYRKKELDATFFPIILLQKVDNYGCLHDI